MNRKKTILILLTSILAMISAGVMTGAISFNPMPSIFQEYWEGQISDAGYNLTAWNFEIIDQDTLRVFLTGSTAVTDDYTFEISIFNSTGNYITNSTRTIAFSASIPRIEMFTISYPDIAPSFKSIDIQVTR